MHDVIKPKSIKQDKEVRALTIDEQKELSDYIFKSSIKDEKYKNVFLIQMYLGLRIGETFATRCIESGVNAVVLQRKFPKCNRRNLY